MDDAEPVWRIDPVTYSLSPDRPVGCLTERRFAEQQWPPCPVCGRVVVVPGIDVRDLGDRFAVLIPGRWRCPVGCTPGIDRPVPQLTPDEYTAELQRVADRYWPDAGIEVRVKVWRRINNCERCGTELEWEIDSAGDHGALFHRVGEFNGRPLRSPHYYDTCQDLARKRSHLGSGATPYATGDHARWGGEDTPGMKPVPRT